MVANLKWYEAAIIFAAGVFVGYVVRALTSSASASSSYVVAQAPQPVEMSNLETWDMKELSDGTIRVVVHRHVKRG